MLDFGVTRYRKRGTEVDAFRWEGLDVGHGVAEWFPSLLLIRKARVSGAIGSPQTLFLDPPSGKGNPLVANVGDWIVRNARGDVFKMTPEKFAETYELEPSGSGWIASIDRDIRFRWRRGLESASLAEVACPQKRHDKNSRRRSR